MKNGLVKRRKLAKVRSPVILVSSIGMIEGGRSSMLLYMRGPSERVVVPEKKEDEDEGV